MRVALSGKMTSGKSLVARRLVDKYDFKELSFAAKMKEVTAELFPRAKYEKDRELLIQVGERMRELDNQVWIRHVLPGIEPDKNIVVSDVRFPAEYSAMRRLDFIMVRMYIGRWLQKQQVMRAYPNMPLVLLDDYSETALDYYVFDYTIDNDKGVPLEEVYEQVDKMIAELKGNV